MLFIKKFYDWLIEVNLGGKNQFQSSIKKRRRLQMLPNVRRLGASVGLVLIFVFGVIAQTPTSVDVMRGRISKAKAFVAVKNFAAAIYELEGIKRETSDPTVNGVVQVMLMSCYLEQLDYKRAQSLLTEVFNAQKANKPNSNYFAVAGQVVRGAKIQAERYKSLGLSVADPNLPAEAKNDVDKMRETVESVVAHSKTLRENTRITADSLALLEEATVARTVLARDDYDANRWKLELADARDKKSDSRTTIINTVNDGLPQTIDANKTLASTNAPIITMTPEPNQTKIIPVSTQTNTAKVENKTPVVEKKEVVKEETPKISPETVAKNEPVVETPKPQVVVENTTIKQPERPRITDEPKTVQKEETVATTPKVEDKKVENPIVESKNPEVSTETANTSPIQVGSLIDYATAKVAPTYPPAAKTMRMTGTVKIEVLLNEDGSIAEVQKTSGPSMLQRAATDALKKWKFKPFMRDGQPVKATGFVSFNFNL